MKKLLLCAALTAMSSVAVAQDTWLVDSGWLSTQYPRTVSTSGVAAGDVIVLEVSLKAGPTGPSTQIDVSTSQGLRRVSLRPGTHVFRYVSSGSYESARFQMKGWDRDDFSRLRIGREPRPNISASLSQPTAERRVTYGYSVGNRALRVSRAVYVDLWAMKGSNKVSLLARQQVQTGANSRGSFGLTLAPTLPNGATHIACVVDPDAVVTESNERDNSVTVALANPALTCEYVIEKNGFQEIQYLRVLVRNTSPTTHIYPVRVRVDYTQQDASKTWLYYRQTELFSKDYAYLPANVQIEHKLPCSSLPMPKGESTHVFATIETSTGIEVDGGDNSVVLPISIGPKFRRLAGRRGVGIHEQVHPEGNAYVVVVHMEDARIASQVSPAPILAPNGTQAWWKSLLAGRKPNEGLVAMFNGTYFEKELWWARGLDFSRGLKVDGKIHSQPKNAPNGTPWQITLHQGYIGIHRYDKPTQVYAGPTAHIIGAQSVKLPAPHKKQTWIALRDPVKGGPNGETLHKTALFFTTQRSTMAQPTIATSVMRGMAESLGCNVGTSQTPANIALIDAGGSRTLRFREDDGDVRIVSDPASARFLPHVIGIYGNK